MQRLFRHAVAIAAVGLVFAVVVGTAPAATPAPRLLSMYEPVMHFDPLEKFRPASVQSFIADSDLERLTAPNTWSLVDSAPEPGDLPAAGTGIWRLNQDSCTPGSALGGLDCYAAAWNEGSGGPVVYGHVAHDGERTVLEYWLFYYDDVYSYAYPPSNFIWQAHEGDWEVVNVVLDGFETARVPRSTADKIVLKLAGAHEVTNVIASELTSSGSGMEHLGSTMSAL